MITDQSCDTINNSTLTIPSEINETNASGQKHKLKNEELKQFFNYEIKNLNIKNEKISKEFNLLISEVSDLQSTIGIYLYICHSKI